MVISADGDMAVRPQSVEDWFHFVPTLICDDGWQVAVATGAGRLLHRSSPWGGHLMRFSLPDLPIDTAPADTSTVIVRPEVRAWALRTYPDLRADETFEVQEQLSPGDAVVRRWARWKFFRLCGLFFCTLSAKEPHHHFYRPELAGNLRQIVRRNYPKQGDSAMAMQSLSEAFEAFMFTRPQASGLFTLEFIFRVPQNGLATWASSHFAALLASGRDLADWFLNRPGIAKMRWMDPQFYVVLTMQSWRRGRPLVPASSNDGVKEDELTVIDAGQLEGLRSWTRYHPRMAGRDGFLLSDYLEIFLERIGEKVPTYQSLDGHELLPYQCAVQSLDWARVRAHFQRAYLLQKTAYRRARGGSSAPSVLEGVEPRFRDDHSFECFQQRLKMAALISGKLVVRKTFVEMEEPESEDSEQFEQWKRPRTVSPLRDGLIRAQ